MTTRQVAKYYGVRPGKNGLAPCPFHGDRKPSLKLDTRFHCFGCGADGDAVDFVSRLFSLPVRDAAKKIAQDFCIDYDPEDFGSSDLPGDGPEQKQIDPAAFERMLAQHHRLLCRWAEQYAPQNMEDAWHPLFIEALQNRSHVEYLLDELQTGTEEERLALTEAYRNEVNQLERRLSASAGDTG